MNKDGDPPRSRNTEDNRDDGPGSAGEFPPSDPAAQPHDAFFKQVFADPRHAAGFFREHLPPSIVEAADWSTLRHLPGSFVKPDLRQIHSNLLFSMKADGRETLVYILFEHQSGPDETMLLRLSGYILEILAAHHRKHGLPLPVVVPLVLNQGPEPWRHPLRFDELFDIPEEAAADLMRFVPKFEHLLLDLARHDPEREESDAFSRVVLGLLKAARIGRQVEFLKRLFAGMLRETAGADSASLRLVLYRGGVFGQMIGYILQVTKELDPGEILRIVGADPEAKKTAMTIAQQFVDKGRKEGLKKGLEKGMWIGKIQALEELLGLPTSPEFELLLLDVTELEARHEELRRKLGRPPPGGN